ncbi:MAG: Peptidyl-prolyl isomerase cwc27 [Ramalina farinacea]|uniref:Peptidyl-prolyl isomerase cwc27 n=1 Tax=Ramalina farinacea TaxID=258253 RepID=A0AA43TWK5_9LECA|nr:Peptidyl-prolyl isomerase cwc27 [Ramalina farinacea]
MSSLYNLEPPPTAKLLLHSTAGPLTLELFAKQTPLASRSFLQHCLDGYYTNTVFHRLIPGFIIQGGDPSNTGEGGESIYPQNLFEDEFHSRLKWNRRGLLGMANEGTPNTNGGQFFFSLGGGDDVKGLQGRNTMFGRISGESIFNLVKLGDAEVEEGGEKPLYPTKITGAEVLVNPFEDMVVREVRKVELAKEQVERKDGAGLKKRKRKGGKVLLSFGDEEGVEEGVVGRKEKFNPKLVRVGENVGASNGRGSIEAKSMERNRHSQKPLKKVEKATKRRPSSSPSPPPPMPEPNRVAQLPLPRDEEPSRSPSTSPEPADVGKMTTLLDKTNAQIADIKASMKRTVQTAAATDLKPKSALEQMVPETAVRGRKRKHGANGNVKGDKQTLDLLSAFKSKLDKAGPDKEGSAASPAPIVEGEASHIGEQGNHTGENNDEEAELCDLHFIANCQSCKSWNEQGAGAESDDGDRGWMAHALSFEKDRLGKDLTFRKMAEEQLVVTDPREKALNIREDARQKKKSRMAGNGAWTADKSRSRV